MQEKSKRVYVITGASSGIGLALAQQLAGRGETVYALARRTISDTKNLVSLTLDVNDPEQVQRVIKEIISRSGRIDVLVQAAGFGLAGAVEAMLPAEAENQMATNFLGVCHLLGPVLAQMRSQKAGLLVHLGSVAGFLPLPFQACYSASKAALSALTLALANEVKPYGIKCLLVQPGDTQTGFTKARVFSEATWDLPYAERCRRSIERMAADENAGMSQEKMASLIIRRMDRRRTPLVYTPGLFYKLADLMHRLLPTRLVNGIMYRLYAS